MSKPLSDFGLELKVVSPWHFELHRVNGGGIPSVSMRLDASNPSQISHFSAHSDFRYQSVVDSFCSEVSRIAESLVHYELPTHEVSSDFLKNWNQDNCICDTHGAPLRVYHGSEEAFDQFLDQPTYFTPSPNYGYIRKSSVVYPSYIRMSSPFFVTKQSSIESLRSDPERIAELAGEGYDGVVYASPENITKGVTGWGNDHAQYLVFSNDQIISSIQPRSVVRAAFGSGRPDRPKEQAPSGILYHHAGCHFEEFGYSKDIGFHFGTEVAALDRRRNVGDNSQDVEVDVVIPTLRDQRCLEVLEARDEPDCLAEEAYRLLMRKLESPSLNLRDTLSVISDDELHEIIEEHQGLPDSMSFHRNAMKAEDGEYYAILDQGYEIERHDDRDSAEARAEEIREGFMKRVRLHMDNPIRLPDLGVWSPSEIAECAGLDLPFIDSLSSLYDNNEDRYAAIRRELSMMGYDGIVYTNDHEDPGSDSYIAFYPEQIEIQPSDLEMSRVRKRHQNLDLSGVDFGIA